MSATVRSAPDAHEQILAPYAMRSAESRGRDHRCEADPQRTVFQRDCDRIVHARSFRRLAYKTQVFVNTEGDLYRSRLTHSVEVTRLGRSAARRLGLNEDLVEGLALVHDLGHPPFGHRGEDMLGELMAAHGGFDHHRQALRIVEELEVRYPEFPGLNLTYELREGLIKLGTRRGDAGIPRRFHPQEGALLEARLVDAVDSIAYDCHDIDDGLRAGVITLDGLSELSLWRGAWDEAVAGSPRGTGSKLLIDRAVRILLDSFLGDLVDHSFHLFEVHGIASVDAVRAAEAELIALGGSMQAAKRELEAWLFTELYRDWRINRTFIRARRIIAELFAFFCAHPETLPEEHARRVERAGRERAVADYIAGMTDRYAEQVHEQLL